LRNTTLDYWGAELIGQKDLHPNLTMIHKKLAFRALASFILFYFFQDDIAVNSVHPARSLDTQTGYYIS
jgi:hypothetical protein